MAVRINDIAPDFTAESTAGTIHFHDWLAGGYAIIFSHPRDFTPVCTTEFGADIAKRDCARDLQGHCSASSLAMVSA